METKAIEGAVSSWLDSHGVKMEAVFVPANTFEGDEWRSKAINHSITFKRGRSAIKTIFSQGIGHLPKMEGRPGTIYYEEQVTNAINTGVDRFRQKLKAPTECAVMYSLLLDASGDFSDFSEWCSEYGYDSDSIKAKEIYDACLAIKLKLEAMFSHSELDELRELTQDY